MLSRSDAKRLGLVLGAGFTKDLGFPDWQRLLDGIASTPNIQLSTSRNNNRHLSKGQALFESFNTNYIKTPKYRAFCRKHGLTDSAWHQRLAIVNAHINAEWLKVVKAVLYRRHSQGFERRSTKLQTLMQKSYHKSILDAFKQPGSIIINYNFDDSVELFLDAGSKRFVSSWGSRLPDVHDRVVVHHPNGYLPKEAVKRGSTSLVFLEGSFQSSLADSIAGTHTALANYYARDTCLFVGVSLEDPMLCHHLHHSASVNPGHVHYYVQRVSDDKIITDPERAIIRKTLFELYNLIVLFLNDEEIKALGELLAAEDSETYLKRLENDCVSSLCFRYYITGCVSAGKSTVLSALYGMDIYGEWRGDMPVTMKDDPRTLSVGELSRIDEFVNPEVARKSAEMVRTDRGIQVVDRCPLDAFAFVDKGKWAERSQSMRTALDDKGVSIPPGHVILLRGDPYDMCVRSIARDKDVTTSWLAEQQERLAEVYPFEHEGITWLDCREKSPGQVVKDILRLIFFSEYVPARLSETLTFFREGGV